MDTSSSVSDYRFSIINYRKNESNKFRAVSNPKIYLPRDLSAGSSSALISSIRQNGSKKNSSKLKGSQTSNAYNSMKKVK